MSEQTLKGVICSALSHIPQIYQTKLDEILAANVSIRDDVLTLLKVALCTWLQHNHWFSFFAKSLRKLAVNLLKPTGYVMHKQFHIQQLYALPTLCFVFI